MAEEHTENGWRAALRWGIGIAVLHRLLLMLWMALVLLVSGAAEQLAFNSQVEALPSLTSPLEQHVFGVWRRWDTIHYFNLTVNDYRASDPGPSVFGPLTPLGFNVFDRLLPGGLDLAAMLFSTAAFALALTLLYRIVATYYDDVRLARWTLIVVALLPLAYFFQAPMSESIYLALILASFYWGTQKRWFLASVAAALATLARSQGALFLLVLGLLFLQEYPPRVWRHSIGQMIRTGWSFALVPLAFFGFEAWRLSIGLPRLFETYRDYSYNYLTNPVDGIVTNLAIIAQSLGESLVNIDIWAMLLTFVGLLLVLRAPLHRRLPLVAYSLGYALLFISRINYLWGTSTIMGTQSFARYTLTLFPLVIFAADRLRQLPGWGRIAGIAGLLLLLMLYSALHALGIGPP